jgi:hypothetical protein
MIQTHPSPATGRLKYRKLRIAFSAACGIICLLLIVLWVRSYWWTDQLTHQNSSTKFVAVTTGNGRLLLGKSDDPMLGRFIGSGWSGRSCHWSKAGSMPFFPASIPILPPRREIFGWPQFSDQPFQPRLKGARYSEVIVPYWLLLLTTTALGVAPWITLRFSLRTLLIAMTLVAAVLAAVVWVAK